MATLSDKLVRAIEVLQPTIPDEGSGEVSSTDVVQARVGACKTIVQCLSRLSVQQHDEYNELMGLTFENLLICCNDKNSDVRVAADEGLNQLINELYGSESSRIQVELFKEIKRNASPRRLKAAIIRFAELSHLIKPQKCRLYVMNLLPLLIEICKREEETIQESLITAMPRIVSILGPFFSEGELHKFLSTLFSILVSSISSSRRMAAECITSLCHNCLKPGIFYSISLEKMLLLTIDSSITNSTTENHTNQTNRGSAALIGGFLGTRKILISVSGYTLAREEDHHFFNTDHISAILTNIFNALHHPDHNVGTAALSCLQALVDHCPVHLSGVFTRGLEKWREGFRGRSLRELLVGMAHSTKNMNLGCGKEGDGNLEVEMFERTVTALPESLNGLSVVEAAAFHLSRTFLVGEDGEPLRKVRVSVKSLVLNCLSGFMFIAPDILPRSLSHLPRLFRGDCDPMLQENTMTMCANHILHSLASSYYQEWSDHFSEYLQIIRESVDDESPKVHKAACDATQVCLAAIIRANRHEEAISLVEALLPLHKSSYWLAKTALLDVLKVVNFVYLSCFTPRTHLLQSDALDAIFIMLADEDSRVQSIAATTLSTIVPHLIFTPNTEVSLRQVVLEEFLQSSRLTNPPPYVICLPSDASQNRGSNAGMYHDHGSLSRLLNIILDKMLTSSSRDMVHGCIEAMACLAATYIDSELLHHWSITVTPGEHTKVEPGLGCEGTTKGGISTSSGILSFYTQYLTSSVYMYDIGSHQSLVTIILNLLGTTCRYLITSNGYTPDRVLSWSLLHDPSMVGIIQDLLCHIMRVLNICCYVCTEEDPGSATENIKEKMTIVKKKKNTENSGEEEPTLNEKLGSHKLGSFTSYVQYMKFYENLKASYEAHKVTLNLQSEEKFVLVLRSTLELFQEILKYSSLKNVGSFAEEANEYLTKLMRKEPVQCISTTRYLLAALFGTNVICNGVMESFNRGVLEVNVNKPISVYVSTPFHIEYFKYSPYIYQKQVEVVVEEPPPAPPEEPENVGFAAKFFGKRSQRSISNSSGGNTKKKAPAKPPQTSVEMQHYIRYFEANVMKSLELYTLTNNAQVQGEILVLLIDLLRLRVNYALLDTDKVFVNFLLKQFEYIEQGQVREASRLLPTLFQFLIMLTKERYQEREVIDIPRIMQLCGTAMASGQLNTASISVSLYPLIHELFLVQEPTNLPHLVTQREVVESILLKNVIHYQVIDILWIVLNWYKPDDRNFRRYSASVWVACTIAISQNRLDVSTLEVMTSLHRLLDVISYDSSSIMSTLTDYALTTTTANTKVAFLSLLLRYLLVVAIRGKFDGVDALAAFSASPGTAPIAPVNDTPTSTNTHKLLDFLIYAIDENLSFILKSTKPPLASFASLNYIHKLVHYVRDKFSPELAAGDRFVSIRGTLSRLSNKYPHVVITMKNILRVLHSRGDVEVTCPSSSPRDNIFSKFVKGGGGGSGGVLVGAVRSIGELKNKPLEEFVKELAVVLDEPRHQNSYAIFHFAFTVAEEYLDKLMLELSSVDRDTATDAILTLRRTLDTPTIPHTLQGKINRCLVLLSHEEESDGKLVLSDAVPTPEWLKTYLATDLCLYPANIYSTVPVLKELPIATLKELTENANFDTALFPPMISLGRKELKAQKSAYVGPEDPMPALPSLLVASKAVLLDRVCRLTGIKTSLTTSASSAGSGRPTHGHKKSNSTSLPKSLALFVDTSSFSDIEDLLEASDSWSRELWRRDVFNYVDALSELLHTGITYSDLAYLDPYQVHGITRLLALGLEVYRNLGYHDIATSLLFLRFLCNIITTRDTCAILYYGEEMRIIENVFGILQGLFGSKLNLVKTNGNTDPKVDKIRSMVNFVLYDLDSKTKTHHPHHVTDLVRKCVLSLSSLPCVSSYIRIPSFLSLASPHDDNAKNEFTLSSIELDFLKDSEVLEDFLFRNLSFGWATKRQFEELWVTMLGMITYRFDAADYSLEEINELCVVNRLAIRGMTTLLMQTLLYPVPGSPKTSVYQHFPWSHSIPFLNTDIGHRMVYPHKLVFDAMMGESRATATYQPYLDDISMYVDSEFCNFLIDTGSSVFSYEKNSVFLHDIDRIPGSSAYYHGYYGATALRERIITNDITDLDVENQEKTHKILNETSDEPDTISCLHFLVDLFGEWVLPESQIPITLLNQIINSVSQLSDMFQKTTHCQWMVDSLVTILIEHPLDDKIMHSKLLFATSKAISLLQADKAGETIIPFLERALTSDFLPLHMAALNGSFYLLESQLACFEGSFINLLTDFILRNLKYDLTLPFGYVAAMWAVAMVILEKFPEDAAQADGFTVAVMQFGMSCLMNNQTPFTLHQLVIRGFQRMVLSFSLPTNENESLIQMASSQLDVDNPQKCLSSFGLLMTCMYCGREGTQVLNLDRDPETLDAMLTGAMDKMRKILDCITHCCESQAKPLASVVCYLVADFFPREQMINTFVSAFLSPRQQNRHLISLILQQLFQGMIREGKFTEIAEWVSLVLRNFVQLQPLGFSIWCTSILLLCSTQNSNLGVLLPHVLHHSHETKSPSELFGLLCRDFHGSILPRDRAAFLEMLQLGGKCHEGERARNEFHLVCEMIEGEVEKDEEG